MKVGKETTILRLSKVSIAIEKFSAISSKNEIQSLEHRKDKDKLLISLQVDGSWKHSQKKKRRKTTIA